MAGRVVSIARREKSRAPMEEMNEAGVSLEAGVDGDYRGGPDERQVTVLTREGWQAACDELGEDVPWTTRRSNILIEGLRIEGMIGKTIRIGDLALQITGETDPCSRMEEQVAGLRQALTPDWRGGVTCRVIAPGHVAVGDAVALEDSRGSEDRHATGAPPAIRRMMAGEQTRRRACPSSSKTSLF